MTREEILQEDDDRNPLALSVGTLLDDQFRIGRVLGAGGFGITYLAFDEVLEVGVAVKEYFPQHLAVDRTSEEEVAPRSTVEKEDFRFGLDRFLDEARTLAKFQDHPNIVRVRTFFEENGTGYLVMNYYEGQTLEHYADLRRGRLPEEEMLYILHALLDGLETVHQEGILHRDVDPSNIYLADKGHVVVLDFGAARNAMGDRTQTLSVMLKQGYAPHEQYHSHGNQGPWTDVYAAAATTYRILTGYKPPEATARVMSEEIVPPKEVAPGISDQLNTALLRGLAVDPDDRPQNVGAFRALLPERPGDDAVRWTEEEFDAPAGATTGGEGRAVVRVTADLPCRVYVDGTEAARLKPDDDPAALNVDPGDHRLRAVRTDYASGATATVTSTPAGNAGSTPPGVPSGATEPAGGESADDDENGEHDAPEDASRVSVSNLIWQDTVTATASETTDVHVTFDPEKAPDTSFDLDATAGTQVSGDGGAPPASGTETAEEKTGDEDGRSRRDGQDGDSLVGEVVDSAQESMDSLSEDLEEVDDVGDAAEVVQRNRTVLGAGLVVLLLLAGVWWMTGGNVPPRPVDDQTVSGNAAVTVDVLENDRDPDAPTSSDADGEGARAAGLTLQSVASLPDSVGTAEVVDSARVRFRPAPQFAGRAAIDYTVADAAGDTASATLSVLVPFNGRARVVTRSAADPQTVVSGDLNRDGERDLLAATYTGNSVVVYPNRGGEAGGRFGGEAVALTETAAGAVDVQTADLDGDRDPDVLAAALRDDAVMWFENVGTGGAMKFSPPETITSDAGAVVAARPGDVNGDGRIDVVVAARTDRRIVWYPNQGSEGASRFGDPRVIADSVRGLESIAVDDFDDDGDPDVASAAYGDGEVAWHENKGGRFETHVIDADAEEVLTVYVDDLNGDGTSDVLAGLGGSDRVVWYAQQPDSVEASSSASTGPLAFASPRLITDAITNPEVVRTADFNGDGDPDVVTASFNSGIISWRENRGDGTFGPRLVVASDAREALDVHAADLDGDGDPDLVSASQADDTIAWYENAMR
jgi:hypothetical protein